MTAWGYHTRILLQHTAEHCFNFDFVVKFNTIYLYIFSLYFILISNYYYFIYIFIWIKDCFQNVIVYTVNIPFHYLSIAGINTFSGESLEYDLQQLDRYRAYKKSPYRLSPGIFSRTSVRGTWKTLTLLFMIEQKSHFF